MKKKFLLLCLSLIAAASMAACDFAPTNQSSSDNQNQSTDTGSTDTGSGDTGSTDTGSTDTGSGDTGSDEVTHVYVSHDAVGATCQAEGNEAYYTCEDCDKIFDANKQEIQAIPVVGKTDHDYVLQAEVAGTCSTAGVISHYTCNTCDTLFDLTKNEIDSTAGELDETNHSADLVLVATAQPTKLTYAVGEEFDSTGMTVAYKCADCDGEIIDNQFLTYEYQTADATAFAMGDTKVTVKFNDLSFEVAVTVTKIQATIVNVEESYETICGVAPTIAATSNVPDEPIVITYYDGETEVTADAFVAGKTYTATLTIAGTDTVEGTQATTTITVAHKYAWEEGAEDWRKLTYECACGDKADFYAMNYQSPYVDAENLGIDLSAYIIGAEDVAIKSVKQIIRMKDGSYVAAKDGEVVDIEYTNEGSVYSFAADKYEQPSGEWKPYILTLSVVYTIGEIECPIVIEAKLIDKLIQDKEDLKALAYKDEATSGAGGVANTSYYVLANDIDASGLVLDESKPAWQEGIGFCGIFEGNGYTISNLNVPAYNNGLFGAVGAGSKIQNVNFTNVTIGKDGALLALYLRKTTLTNVSVEFNVDSTSNLVANTANDSTFVNVSVKTCVGCTPFLNVGDSAITEIPAGITLNYYPTYTVQFDTDGGNAIDAQTVTGSKKATAPANPVKTSEEYEYTFLGWYNGEEEWSFDTPITEDIKLVAKWKETKKASVSDVIAMIEALPDAISLMPSQIYCVPAITSAKAEYDKLDDAKKEEVSNYAKLESLLAQISGYETVYVPAVGGINAIAAVIHAAAGTTVTGAFLTDATQGTTFVSTANEGGKAAIQFHNFPSVAGYDKIYFYVRSSVAGKLYMADSAENDGWGTNWKNNSGDVNNYAVGTSWTLVSVDVSTGIISSNWTMSMWSVDVVNTTLEVGAIIGCKTSEIPQSDRVVSSLTFGKMEATSEINEYGMVYNLTQGQWYIDNGVGNTMGDFASNSLANTLPTGFDHYEFYMYNPTETVYNFHLAGGEPWTDSADSYALAARAWTKVTISSADIAAAVNGQWYAYILGGDGKGAAAEGWKISTIYAVRAATDTPDTPAAEKVEVEPSFLGAVADTGTTNDYGKVYNLTQGQWFINNNDSNTMSDLPKERLANALPAGYDYFEFYLYNPSETAYNFHLAGDVNGTWTDGTDGVSLAAKAWTKVVISKATIEYNQNGTWYFYIQGGGAGVAGWQISTVYAVKA